VVTLFIQSLADSFSCGQGGRERRMDEGIDRHGRHRRDGLERESELGRVS